MIRWRCTVVVAAAIATLSSGRWSAQTLNPPSRRLLNVVPLIIGDTRWDSIGAAGNRIVRTGRIEQLAREGVRFTVLTGNRAAGLEVHRVAGIRLSAAVQPHGRSR
jgi:hypothetical protein